MECCNEEPAWCVNKVPDFRDVIPKHGYIEEVAKLALQKPGEPISFRSCAGPGVLSIRRLNYLAIVMNIALLAASVTTAQCDDSKFARIQWFLWVSVLPIAVKRVWEERQCIRYITIPYIQIRGQFGPLCCPLSYDKWIIWMHAITLLQLADNVSDVFFVSRTFKSEQCNDYLMTRIFREVISKSLLKDLPINFAYLVMMSFVVLLAQFAHGLLGATPQWNSKKVDYELGDKREDGTALTQNFTNLMGEETNTGDALCSLAEGVGFGSSGQIGLLYPRAKEQYHRKAQSTLRRAAIGPYAAVPDVEESEAEFFNPEDVHKSLIYVQNALHRGVARVFLVALVENSVQVNMQITVLALRLAASAKHHQATPTIAEVSSVVLSVITAVLKFNEGLFLLRFSFSVRTAIDRTWQESSSRSSVSFFGMRKPWGSSAFNSLPDETKRLYSNVMFHTWAIRGISILLVFSTAYAVAKFYAVFHCEYSVWNITGCVDLGPVLDKLHLAPLDASD